MSLKNLTPLIRPITVRTCVGLYDQLRLVYPHLFGRRPSSSSDGVDITVNYADTALLNPKREYSKTIVALHGNPGSYEHFARLLQHFGKHPKKGVRVIAPNMPNFSHTRQCGFWSTVPEKAAFIRDFLQVLKVKQIDCLVAHSLGLHTAACIWGESESPIQVKSSALFSPQSFWVNYNHAFDPTRHVFTFRNAAWYKMLELSRIHRWRRWPMKYANIDEFLHSSSIFLDDPIMQGDNLRRQVDYATQKTGIRFAFVHGEKDPLVLPESTRELHRRFGLEDSDVIRLNLTDPELLRKPIDEVIQKTDQRVVSYIVTDSGHFAFAKYAAYSNRLIENLLSSGIV